MVDKEYCMSSYLAFRYIAKANVDFAQGLAHDHFVQKTDDCKIAVSTADEIDRILTEHFQKLSDEKLGILLSGGMDSAILAAYMPGSDAYTFRFLGGEYQKEELQRAEYYAKYYGLNLHYVDIDWCGISNCLDHIMQVKQAPVHSIEPQIFLGAARAKQDGVTKMIIGDASDYVFGGMDKLLSVDWKFEDFYRRLIYVDPADVLCNYVDMRHVLEPFRQDEYVDFLGVMDSVVTDESYSSYMNAFKAAEMPYSDPYEGLKMAGPLDLKRIRNGESKYLIRELFHKKYPDIPIPEKIPMPRMVDFYFENWGGPKRPEFKKDINMASFSGNQKWLLYCLERFLNLCDK